MRNSLVSELDAKSFVAALAAQEVHQLAPGAAACCCMAVADPVPSVIVGYWLSSLTLAPPTSACSAGVEVGHRRSGRHAARAQVCVCQVKWPSVDCRRA